MAEVDPAAKILAEAQEIAAKAWSRGEKSGGRWRIVDPPTRFTVAPNDKAEPLIAFHFDPKIAIEALLELGLSPVCSCGSGDIRVTCDSMSAPLVVSCQQCKRSATGSPYELIARWSSPPPSAGG